MLPEFLARARGLWDELVAVDTGSQDETVAILEAAGATVLHRPWQNDFALARNVSLEAASGRSGFWTLTPMNTSPRSLLPKRARFWPMPRRVLLPW